MAETVEAFASRIRAGADSIPIVRGQQQTTLAKLSEADRNAHISRWYADGIDPLSGPTTAEKRAAVNAYPIAPGSDPELFYGWVQRAIVPGPGYEWAMIEIPRHVVEGLAKPDKAGRKVRRDTREVMTGDIIAELASWALGNRSRGDGVRCHHRFFFNPTPITDKKGVTARGRSECVQCGMPEVP